MKFIKNLRNKTVKDRGILVGEAAFVYLVMFFTIIFLMYMGNIFFLKAQIDNVVNLEAVRGAAEYSDPMFTAIYNNGSQIPSSGSIDKNIQPYRYLFPTGSDGESIRNIKSAMEVLGFFIGMEPEIISVDSKANNYFLYHTYEVTTTYRITFPVKFIFSDDKFP